MGRTNPISLRLKGLVNWTSNIRHPFLNKYLKHVFQKYIMAEPGIRASTQGLWVNVTILEQQNSLEALDHPFVKDPILNLRDYESWSKVKSETLQSAEGELVPNSGYDFLFGRKETRVRHLLHGGRTKNTQQKLAKPHFYFGRLAKDAPLNQLDALGLKDDFLKALHIYNDTPIHIKVNVIQNPLMNASILAEYVARELSNGTPLPRIQKDLLGRMS